MTVPLSALPNGGTGNDLSNTRSEESISENLGSQMESILSLECFFFLLINRFSGNGQLCFSSGDLKRVFS